MREKPVTARHVHDVGQIPSVPGVVLVLIEACHRVDVGFEELAQIIRKDAGLCARVLAVAGACEPGSRGAPIGLNEIVASLGMETIRSIAVAAAVQQFFSRFDSGMGKWLGFLWQRSLLCAHGARLLAGLTRYESAEDAYLSGLLHRLGQLHFLHREPVAYPEQLSRSTRAEALSRAEHGMFGVTGAEVGAALIRQWDPRSLLSDAVLYQGETAVAVQDAPHLVRLTNLACSLCAEDAGSDILCRDAGLLFGISASVLEDLQRQMREDLAEALAGIRVDRSQDEDDGISVDGEEIRLALARRVRESAQLDGIRQHLSGASELKGTLTAALQDCRILFGVSRSICFLREERGGHLLPEIGTCPGADYVGEFRIRLASESSLIARALLERRRLSTLDGASSDLSVVDRQLLRVLECDGFLCLPLHLETEEVGVLALGVSEPELERLRGRENLLCCFGEAVAQALSARQQSMRERQLAVSQERERHQGEIGRLVHEANNPLSIIKNYLQVLSLRLGGKEEVSEQLAILNEEIERVADIIARMREAPVGSGHKTGKVDVNGLIKDLTGIFRVSHFAARGITVEHDLDRNLPLILTDRDSLKQILTNLFKNAGEGLPDRGRLTVSTRDQVNLDGNPFIELVVEDDGPGIPTEVLGSVFRPVKSRKGSAHAGLGLAIVRELVTGLNGSISCSNRSKGGAQFVVMLPRKTE